MASSLRGATVFPSGAMATGDAGAAPADDASEDEGGRACRVEAGPSSPAGAVAALVALDAVVAQRRARKAGASWVADACGG
ncbi:MULTISPECIES: hypothetical protein [Sorangium]|nr:hypothetical protein [Sorangium cellulosum]